ncbi:unnamed protein product [Gongylonema pulchrum]|uniref:CNNM transmembrane domain-containing protein n=1 Tax=Gongylonema pulchrum TaxID=637853 RepID=A0A183EBR5_9BILA|nr:unnamed protein product [Gongylonema pulchrum]
MQRKPPVEADTNLHKEQVQARINASKVKFSLLLLALMSVVAVLFGFLALQSLLAIQWKSAATESSGHGEDSSTMTLRTVVVYEVASSLSLIAVTTSISTFLLSTLQLFFALKFLKTSPTSVKRLVNPDSNI